MQTRKAPLIACMTAVALLGVKPLVADTVATFADPTVNGTTPLFTVGATTLSGGWSGSGLNLVVPGSGHTYEDVTFTMSDVAITDSQLGGGAIEFYASAADGGVRLLQITFDGGVLRGTLGFNAGASSGNTVTFAGTIITDTLEDTAFSFGFANPITTTAGTTYTASFTSSGTVVTSDGDGTSDADGDSTTDGTGDTGGGTTVTPPGLCGPLPCTTLAMLPLSLLALSWLRIRDGSHRRSRG